MPWPSYTYYTGQMRVIPLGMASPVFSHAEFRNNTSDDYDNYCNLYVGRINSSDAAPVTSVFYGTGYQLWYGGAYQSVTDTYPAVDDDDSHRNPCDLDARTLVSHSYRSGGVSHHRDSYADYYYQGVN